MAKKHKKNKKNYNVKPTSPVKVILPVVIGLAVVFVVALVLGLTSKSAVSAKVNNPKQAYATVGNYKITNQEAYETLKSSIGLTKLAELVDAELLKDVAITDEDYQEAYDKAVYGSEIIANRESLAKLKEELTGLSGRAKAAKEAEIKALEDSIKEAEEEALLTFNFNMTYMGLDSEEKIKEYVTLLAKRDVYTKDAYAKFIKDGNDFTDESYIAKYKENNNEVLEDSATVLAVVFASSEQAKEYLELLSTSVYTNDLSKGWKKANDQFTIDELNSEKNGLATANTELEAEIEEYNNTLSTLNQDLEALQAAEVIDEEAIAEKRKEIDAVNDSITNANELIGKNNDRITEIAGEFEGLVEASALSELEVTKLFIELYNLYYAYYLGGDVSTYFNVDEEGRYTSLNADYQILKEGVHYNIGEESVQFNLEALEALTKEYSFVKFNYTASEATSLLSNVVISTLKLTAEEPAEGEEAEEVVKYTYSPLVTKASYYYLAFKLAEEEGLEKSHLEELIANLKSASDEEKETIRAEIDSIKDSLRDELIEDNYTDDQETRFLIELRQANGLKIYDRYLNATYKAAYDYLYGTTLKMTDYTEYASDGGQNKKLAFSFKDGEISYTAQQLFEEFQKVNGISGLMSLLNAYVILSNPEYNDVYNPYTKKVYDKNKLDSYLNSDYSSIYMSLYSGSINTVKGFKFAFENDLFKSYGFDHKYGWQNFLRDYLLARDEKHLAATLSLNAAEDKFYLSKYSMDDIKAEMQKIYDEYYSMTVVNLLIGVDYNRDGTPDTYNLEGDQAYWTEYQSGLAQELTDLLYAQDSEETTLVAKLQALQKSYSQATFQDPTFGKFIAAGLTVKAESSAEYTSSSSLVQEFHDEMAVLYKAIEAAEGYTLGEWTDDEKAEGFQDETVFPTVYGYHRVTAINANARVYVNSENSTDLSLLTMDLYKQYSEDSKSVDATIKTAIETYFVPALSNVGTSNVKNLLKQELRLESTKDMSFGDSSYKEQYLALEEIYKTYINNLIELEK